MFQNPTVTSTASPVCSSFWWCWADLSTELNYLGSFPRHLFPSDSIPILRCKQSLWTMYFNRYFNYMEDVKNSEKTGSHHLQNDVSSAWSFISLQELLSPWSCFNLASLKVNIIWIGAIHFVSGHLIYPAQAGFLYTKPMWKCMYPPYLHSSCRPRWE